MAHRQAQRLGRAPAPGEGAVLLAPARRAGRLGIDADDLMRRRQRPQRGHRELRRSHEDDLHPARPQLLGLARSASCRFSGDRWSKYILPARWSIWCCTLVAQRSTKSRSSIAPVGVQEPHRHRARAARSPPRRRAGSGWPPHARATGPRRAAPRGWPSAPPAPARRSNPPPPAASATPICGAARP